MPMHRFSPFSTKAIKKTIKKKRKKKLTIDDLVLNLMELGYSFDNSIACISYLENICLNEAIDIIEKFK
tara:strand:- start:10 stop:216 length:207 start_codon:yes stop_codon:yes gene_type:complete